MLQSRLLHTSGLLLAAMAWLANGTNPPNGLTGAPFDGHCNSCHGGNNPNGFDGRVILQGLPNQIAPNKVYPLALTLSTTSTNVPTLGGFQLVVVDDNNTNSGHLSVMKDQGTGVDTSGGREYLEHRDAKKFSGQGSRISWNFYWKSPTSLNSNQVKFYYIGSFCDSISTNNAEGGDFLVTGQTTVNLVAQAETPKVVQSGQVTSPLASASSEQSAADLKQQEQERRQREEDQRVAVEQERRRQAAAKAQQDKAKSGAGTVGSQPGSTGTGAGSPVRGGSGNNPFGPGPSAGGSSGDGASASIGGGLSRRALRYRAHPKIDDNSQKAGTVVIELCVDSEGNVTSANYTMKGSTTVDPELVESAKNAAKQFKFVAGSDNDCGRIVFKFQVK